MESLASVDLLHIDDLGAERSNEWVLEQLYSIINTRYEDERSIILTTNLTEEQLREQIKERTVSRLVEMCGDPLPLFGADQRREVQIPEHLTPGARTFEPPARYGEAPAVRWQ
jgi:DNA replication protein DnaC